MEISQFDRFIIWILQELKKNLKESIKSYMKMKNKNPTKNKDYYI